MRPGRLVLTAALLLILFGSGALFYSKSKSEPVNQWWFARSTTGKHHVGESFFMSWRTRISLEWSSPLPVTIAVARLQDMKTIIEGGGKPLFSQSGRQGSLDYAADRDGDYVLILDADVDDLKDLPLRGTVTMSYSARPFVWAVPLSVGFALLALAVMLRGSGVEK